MDICRYVILSLNFSEIKIIGIFHCVLGKVELGFWGKKKTGFQGDGENLHQIQPQYLYKNIVCVYLQTEQNLTHKNDQ